jgi:GAF domain-containing protein/ribosomal protein L37E
VSKENEKPVFDEHTLAKVLEAAFVVQEHNRALQALPTEQAQPISAPADEAPEASPTGAAAKDDYTFTLAQIVETQHQIQVRHLELDSAIKLVAERTTQIARASGAAIGLLDGSTIRYRGAYGQMTLPVGAEIAAEKALCTACLRSSQVVRCEEVGSEALLDAAECQRRGIRSMIAVPVYQVGAIAGALELYYGHPRAFTQHDVHTCQLMAGLVTEALARTDELAWKKSLANERSLMLEALEKLKPNLAALIEESEPKDSSLKASAPAASLTPGVVCRECGHQLVGEEQYCGHCGSPRSGDYKPPTMQSKVASLWHMQQALEKNAVTAPTNGSRAQPGAAPSFDESQPEKPLADSIEEEMPELFAGPEFHSKNATPPTDGEPVISAQIEDAAQPNLALLPEDGTQSEGEDGARPETVLTRLEPAAQWSSAASARDFLERLAAVRTPTALARFWKARRGDFYLAIAVILVACVIRWGIWSNHPVSATGSSATATHRKPVPNADLPLLDRILVRLGLAEAPEPEEYKGNPETQVWVDPQTALYYCPGADLYGKTPKGRFTTQHDAQLDQFEPAYRKACD